MWIQALQVPSRPAPSQKPPSPSPPFGAASPTSPSPFSAPINQSINHPIYIYIKASFESNPDRKTSRINIEREREVDLDVDVFGGSFFLAQNLALAVGEVASGGLARGVHHARGGWWPKTDSGSHHHHRHFRRLPPSVLLSPAQVRCCPRWGGTRVICLFIYLFNFFFFGFSSQ